MSPLSALNNAVLILQPQLSTSAAASVGDSLVASINRVHAGAGAGSPLTQAQARITESMFSVNNLDATQMKARLFERVGKEFGIDQDDYDSLSSYGSAIKTALDDLKQKSSSIAEIEKKLGLDELGISLDTLVNAIVDPNGSDGDRLDAALEKKAGDRGSRGEGKAASHTPTQPGEIGLYGG
ncbi:hypothetical protein RFN29_11600 [Mesorhizobium sp. VK22B]|uniref:DUF5610 domain-containing protein n=1 Tax=Mesorhizobium captivum TaxID=3072319 RepID=A0ABU4YZ46_9HYPH|nr:MULTISPECIES: hypothetical protein [unclassified Mesorhizobium]MDX8492226.1 hypothetical protein [Mesorhizobium sp. VK22B]MDX8506304.1 hypothetical protein [Mesorhizobium sp. VK22E]